jgi:hypothetical protein
MYYHKSKFTLVYHIIPSLLPFLQPNHRHSYSVWGLFMSVLQFEVYLCLYYSLLFIYVCITVCCLFMSVLQFEIYLESLNSNRPHFYQYQQNEQYLSPQIIEHKTNHDICRWKSRFLFMSVLQFVVYLCLYYSLLFIYVCITVWDLFIKKGRVRIPIKGFTL